jgi:hypothetical protein
MLAAIKVGKRAVPVSNQRRSIESATTDPHTVAQNGHQPSNLTATNPICANI